MDYNQDPIFGIQFDVPKMPFYMSYPMQNLYLTEMEYEKDMERMKELYPRETGRILECVEEECDKMEYEGSLMFDEYPDRLMLEMVVDRIYDKVKEDEREVESEQYWGDAQLPKDTSAQQVVSPQRPGRRRRDDHLHSLIGVLLNNEMYRRRCRHRRCRRWW